MEKHKRHLAAGRKGRYISWTFPMYSQNFYGWFVLCTSFSLWDFYQMGIGSKTREFWDAWNHCVGWRICEYLWMLPRMLCYVAVRHAKRRTGAGSRVSERGGKNRAEKRNKKGQPIFFQYQPGFSAFWLFPGTEDGRKFDHFRDDSNPLTRTRTKNWHIVTANQGEILLRACVSALSPAFYFTSLSSLILYSALKSATLLMSLLGQSVLWWSCYPVDKKCYWRRSLILYYTFLFPPTSGLVSRMFPVPESSIRNRTRTLPLSWRELRKSRSSPVWPCRVILTHTSSSPLKKFFPWWRWSCSKNKGPTTVVLLLLFRSAAVIHAMKGPSVNIWWGRETQTTHSLEWGTHGRGQHKSQ